MSSQLIALPSTATLVASGAQCRDLLQAQLTQEVHKWPADQARPAAYCTPQGRMAADFVLIPQPDGGVALLLHASLADSALKRLRMFILRLQCRLEAAPLPVFGLLLAPGADSPLPLPQQPWGLLRQDGLCLVRLPDAPGQLRVLLLPESEAGQARLAALQHDCAAGTESDWELAAIRAGSPRLSAATAGAFVPQMLNAELLGAIDFKKGCYPGQEVVARTAYRGTIKRRCYRVGAEVALPVGAEIYDAAEPGQPCGMVVNAAPSAAGWEALAELKMAAAESAQLRLGSGNGAPLHLLSLPYALATAD